MISAPTHICSLTFAFYLRDVEDAVPYKMLHKTVVGANSVRPRSPKKTSNKKGRTLCAPTNGSC